MPTKPPIRIAAPFPKSKPAVKIAPGATRNTNAPRPQPTFSLRSTKPSPPPSPRWYQNPALQTSTRYVAWTTHGVLLLCAMVWLRDHYADLQHVRGSSMAPTLNPTTHETGEKDTIIMRPYQERSLRKQTGEGVAQETVYGVQRGDVVTFWKPHKPQEISIKRVVAIEGDTVYPRRGYALELEAYKDRLPGFPDGLPDSDVESITAGTEALGTVVVPYGHIWIEGDNWRNSLDSNDFGPISKGLVLGKAVWVWRSWFRFDAVGDARNPEEKNEGSRVIQGKSQIPAIFLE